MLVWEQLPKRWGDMCRTAGSSTFAWAHDGVHRNGFIELHENGKVTTTWVEGYWKAVEGDADLLEVTFGSSKHHCRYKEGGFEVERKYLRRTGNDNSKGCKSCGWIETASSGKKRPRTLGPRAGSLDDDEVTPATYDQKDITFEPFYNAWKRSQEAAAKRRRAQAEQASKQSKDAN